MQTLLNLLELQARERPGSPALLGLGRPPLSYIGLVLEVRKVASALAAFGVKRNDAVAIVLPNGPEIALAFFSVTAVATAAPLNPAYSQAEFEFYLRDLKARALLILPGLAPAAVNAAQVLDIPIIEIHSRRADAAGTFGLSRSGICAAEFARWDDVALMLHTSGTTSKPKLVPLTQSNLVCSAQNIARSLQLKPQDRCLNIMPLFHVHGLLGALSSSLSVGGSVVCAPGHYPVDFSDWLARYEPTWFTAVPTMHQGLLSRLQASNSQPSHCLRFIRSCSSALAPSLMAALEKQFGVPVIEAYGMTEAAHQIAINPLPPGRRKAGSVGLAAGAQVAIMDEAGHLLPLGARGEVVIRGENVTVGYVANPEANQSAFVNAWFRTGDQGYLDSDGYLFLNGRIKEIINRGGEKISPREVDEVLLEHPAVVQAVAFGIPDATLEENVAAAVVLRENNSLTEQELRDFAAGRLAHFKVPARFLFVREIPKGPTGKVQRRELPRLLGLNGEKPPTPGRPAFIPPTTVPQKGLAEIWRELLGIAEVGLEDDFQNLGGDSLTATRLVSRLKQSFQIDMPLSEILNAPKFAAQALLLEKALQKRSHEEAELEQLVAEAEAHPGGPKNGLLAPGVRAG